MISWVVNFSSVVVGAAALVDFGAVTIVFAPFVAAVATAARYNCLCSGGVGSCDYVLS